MSPRHKSARKITFNYLACFKVRYWILHILIYMYKYFTVYYPSFLLHSFLTSDVLNPPQLKFLVISTSIVFYCEAETQTSLQTFSQTFGRMVMRGCLNLTSTYWSTAVGGSDLPIRLEYVIILSFAFIAKMKHEPQNNKTYLNLSNTWILFVRQSFVVSVTSLHAFITNTC